MPRTNFNELLEAGVHFGHLKRKWNPNMAPYIFMERNGIHIIDLHKTVAKLEEASAAIKQISKSGKKILFVATKKQAKEIVSSRAKEVNMPYITERWAGGTLTNFPTIRRAVKKMISLDHKLTDGTFMKLSKRERLQIQRQKDKLEFTLGSISDLNRMPAALFVVDVLKEYIAVREANKLNITIFAVVDTNSDPNNIDFPIPANDDASKSIDIIVSKICEAIEEGNNERTSEKEKIDADKKSAAKSETPKKSAAKVEVKEEEKKEIKEEPKAENAEEKKSEEEKS